MKTTIIILAAVLTLNAGMLIAENDNVLSPVTNEITAMKLAPLVPKEATFEDVEISVIDLSIIAPVTPVEADFNDIALDATINLTNLAPVTPAEADFLDAMEVETDIVKLAPVTPAVADFE